LTRIKALAGLFEKGGLIVKQIHLAGSAIHKKLNDPFRLGAMMGIMGGQWGNISRCPGGQSLIVEHGSQANST
jgi:hypothetical protein